MRWTEAKVEKLKQLWAEGLSASKIAQHFGPRVTRNAIIGKAHRLELAARIDARWSGPRLPKDDKIAIERRRQTAKFHRPKNPAPKPPKVKFTAAVPVPVPVEHRPNPTRLSQISEGQCRFIEGEPVADALMCGATVKPGSAYCEHHHSRLYYPATEPKRRVKTVADLVSVRSAVADNIKEITC